MSASGLISNRRGFLGAVAAVSGTFTGFVGSAEAATGERAASATPWDLSWADKVAKAKHRMIFDAAEVDDGTAIYNAWTWLRDYRDIYKADGDAAAVIVVRHLAMPIVLGDDVWSRLQLGMETKMKDMRTGADLLRNPFVNKKPEEGIALDDLIKRGVVVLGCSMALMNYVKKFAASEKIPEDEAHAKVTASLVPGVILMPSGIFAVSRAQDAGCHYMRSS